MTRRRDQLRRASGLALVLVCLATLVGGALLAGSPPEGSGGLGSGFEPEMPGPEGPGQSGAGQGEGQGEGTGDSSSGDGDSSDGSASSANPPEWTTQNATGAYEISVSEPIRPGKPATITVRRDGSPVDGVGVSLDGEFAGRTDQFGRTTAVVPYVADLTIAAERASHRTAGDAGTEYHPGLEAGAPAPGIVTENVSVPTNVSVAPYREPRPGRTVSLLAHVDGASVADGRVLVNGDPAGRTGENGRFSVDVPWNASTTVAVERGAAAGSRELGTDPLEVSVTNPGLGMLAAGQSAVVRVTQGGRPVDGATVAVGDDDPVRTDADGAATVTLPRRGSVGVEAQRGDMTASTTLDGLYTPYIAAAVGVGAVLIGLVVLVVFRGRIGAAAAAGYRYATWFGLRLIVVLLHVSDALVAVSSRLRATLADLAASLRRRDPGAALVLLRERVRAAVESIVARVRSLSLASLLRGGTAATGTGGTAAAAAGGETAAGFDAIRRAFDALLRRVPGRVETLTPTEVGQRAVDRGLPEEAVWTIADAFRAVTYGGRDPATAVEDVRAAVERVRTTDEANREGDE
ncbi:DUF4129 domain-containing protein [Halomicrobium urmianum]|uniref:DUF4129 domain-containing protein n=1 Tax=Halomicrobium urmianum TaxID=1586233 RepID=UPI001CD91C2D|nr:DUF4129 domain-containing protein [Halomicrobium urmianum]